MILFIVHDVLVLFIVHDAILFTVTYYFCIEAKTEKRDKDGNTPLLIAMHNGACKEIIEALLSKAKLKLHEHANNKVHLTTFDSYK